MTTVSAGFNKVSGPSPPQQSKRPDRPADIATAGRSAGWCWWAAGCWCSACGWPLPLVVFALAGGGLVWLAEPVVTPVLVSMFGPVWLAIVSRSSGLIVSRK